MEIKRRGRGPARGSRNPRAFGSAASIQMLQIVGASVFPAYHWRRLSGSWWPKLTAWSGCMRLKRTRLLPILHTTLARSPQVVRGEALRNLYGKRYPFRLGVWFRQLRTDV